MQQLFGMVNTWLSKSPEARARRPSICTSRGVPLGERSAILEWCQGTMPLAAYLTQPKTGAHVRYYKDDWTPKDCRRRFDGKP